MKTSKNILIAFMLNLAFSVFEFLGGIFTGSVAILSDALHDLGDAASIGISYYMERKSRGKPDNAYTYGYGRYSVMGGFITTLVLLLGSVIMIGNAIARILQPVSIHYDGMILFAVAGVIVNFCAAYFTRENGSVNQKAVNLHMLEDVLGWAVVLLGAVIMRFTKFALIDPIMSIGVSVYILVHAVKNLISIGNLFLEKAPEGIETDALTADIMKIEGISDVHHIHVWSLDGNHHLATMHIVAKGDGAEVKPAVRKVLLGYGIRHSTLELEGPADACEDTSCQIGLEESCHCHHHHHHHH